MFKRPEQFLNALLLIVFSEAGMVMFASLVQFLKASIPMEVMSYGKLTVFRELQPRNVPVIRLFTEERYLVYFAEFLVGSKHSCSRMNRVLQRLKGSPGPF